MYFGIIFLLLLLNGFFAMAEMAIVSVRRPRLRRLWEEEKVPGAFNALKLCEDPGAFFSIVQVGVSLVSILTGAFSGATLGEALGLWLNRVFWIAPYGETVGMALTVAGVTYLSLVFGELLPKRIGLSYAEPVAIRVAGIMLFLARVAAPVVWLLRVSTEGILRTLHLGRAVDASVTEEEVKSMLAEGARTGIFKPAEKEMIEGVMRLADRSVRTIMTPRIDMVWLCTEDSDDENAKIIRESGYSRLPVAKGDMQEVLGIVYAKDMLDAALRGEKLNFLKTMRPPFLVPDTTSVLRLLDQFKKSSRHIAIVIDEYGSVEGMVTVTDILEGITGDLPEAGQEREDAPVRRTDGSWLIDGMMPLDEVEVVIGLKRMREGEEFHTLAGFVIDKLGRLPKAGDSFEWKDVRFEVVDMDARRVDKVLVAPLKQE